MPMSSSRSIALSEFSEGRWTKEPPLEPPLHPTELDLIRSVRSSRIKRALLAPAAFLIAFCTGVAGTLVWQSYADTARRAIAQLSPQLGWLAPPAPPVAPAEPAAPLAASPDQLGAISRSLAVVRQSVDKLAADIARLQATKQDTASPDIRVSRTSAPAPPAASAPGRKPAAPVTSQTPAAR
jgi:hypothetical protein